MADARRLFLYGGRSDNFAVTTRPFVEAAGGARARIALLLAGGGPDWARHVPGYRDPWVDMGVPEVVVVAPDDGTAALAPHALAELARCTAIFMGGGDTRLYHRFYGQGEARRLLAAAYSRGLPYGGLSAGALIVPTACLLWGDRLTTEDNRLRLRGADSGCDSELVIGEGLGFLTDLLIEAHFSERGGYPRLVAGLQQARVGCGLGLDDETCVTIADEARLEVTGRGRAYFVRCSGPRSFLTTVLAPGAQASLDALRSPSSAAG